MSDETTGATLAFEHRMAGTDSFVRNTKVQDARCEAYDIPYEQSAVEKRVGHETRRRQRVGQRDDADALPTDRYALGLHLKRAKAEVAGMQAAARDADPMALAEAGIGLSRELRDLWNLREIREEAWQAALNFLQAALAQEQFERFRIEQCAAVGLFIDQCLAGGAVESDDVERAKRILQGAGLDPWKALSAPAQGL